jgi:hypothetical protein
MVSTVHWTWHADGFLECDVPKCREWHKGHQEDELKESDLVIKHYANGAEETAIIGIGRTSIKYNTGDLVYLNSNDQVVSIHTHDGLVFNA